MECNGKHRLEFYPARIPSHAELLLFRELDEAFRFGWAGEHYVV